MKANPVSEHLLFSLQEELSSLADTQRAKNLAWFFKTGKGQYGEGDRFRGITVPDQRKVARRYLGLPLPAITRLLASDIHEHRFTVLVILVGQYRCSTPKQQEKIFEFYLQKMSCINNWDLVDTSAPYIIGGHLKSRSRELLYRLAQSENLWERRIAIVSTLAFVKDGDTTDAIGIAEVLLSDDHDLIHKAVGWVLREIGKVSRPQLLSFLKQHYSSLPRTTLRYAIERFPAPERKHLLQGVFPSFTPP